MLERLAVPIVGAPLAGGPSTPALAAAVSEAGGLGFLAAGYLTPAAMAEDIAAAPGLTSRPFGVNVFAAAPTEADPGALEAYARRGGALVPGVAPGAPRSDDDTSREGRAAAREAGGGRVVHVRLPPREVVERLRAAGTECG